MRYLQDYLQIFASETPGIPRYSKSFSCYFSWSFSRSINRSITRRITRSFLRKLLSKLSGVSWSFHTSSQRFLRQCLSSSSRVLKEFFLEFSKGLLLISIEVSSGIHLEVFQETPREGCSKVSRDIFQKNCQYFIQKFEGLSPEVSLETFSSFFKRKVVHGFTQMFAQEFPGILQEFSRKLIQEFLSKNFQDFSRN